MVTMTSIDKIYEFYNDQPTQHRHLDIIKNWFLDLITKHSYNLHCKTNRVFVILAWLIRIVWVF